MADSIKHDDWAEKVTGNSPKLTGPDLSSGELAESELDEVTGGITDGTSNTIFLGENNLTGENGSSGHLKKPKKH